MTTRIGLIDAFLAGDSETAAGLLAEDATFHSPVRSYRGVDEIRSLWAAVAGIVQDVRTATLLEGDYETAAFFEGSVDGHAIDGVLRVRAPHGSPVTDVTLMLRPLGPLKAAIAEMGRRLMADPTTAPAVRSAIGG
jgi:hypothetical protein